MKYILVLILILVSSTLHAKLKVVTTSPDLSWLVKQVGGDRVKVDSLLDGSEDPHFVDAMPNWIAKASKADVFCLVGLELEVGWAPKILQRSSNKNIQVGNKGYCNVGKFVTALEIPKEKIDRSMGDVHSSGNPHYHLSPEQFKNAAKGVFEILVNNDAKGFSVYKKNLDATIKTINSIKQKVATILKSKENLKLMSYHKEFSYFIDDFNLNYYADIEEVPGVPPSAGRIARIALEAKSQNVDLVLGANSNPKKILEKFREISGVSYKQIPISIRKKGKPSNYEELLVGVAKAIVESK